ncbi:MAG: hypothetical protein KGJ78_14145 [Alphaproteobacteria bacterium]|nr:hypothetical protein [Alphaproteobacteria bacterium]
MTMVRTVEGGGLRGLLGRPFYLLMALLIATVVVYGFSHTIVDNLIRPIHPSAARPTILYVHGAVFSGWLALFLLQASLVWSRNTAVHKRVGLAGLVLASAVPVVGIATVLAMARFRIAHGSPAAEILSFLPIPLNDIIVFSTCVVLAAAWRRWPEYHRRLMLVATCALTSAGFGRFPIPVFSDYLFYAGVDALILIAMARDWIVMRRVHAVYLWALPPMVALQSVAIGIFLTRPAWWMPIARALMQ